jgi:hypothetical protein
MRDPRYLELEAPIHDVSNMAAILAKMLENDGSNGVLLGNSIGLKKEQVVFTDQSWGLIVFAICHLQSLIEDLRTKYHGQIDAKVEA